MRSAGERAGDLWDTLYAEAVEGLDVLPTATEAVAWVGDFLQRIDSAGS